MDTKDARKEKKRYHSPKLVVYGDVRKLTERGPGNRVIDATYPQVQRTS